MNTPSHLKYNKLDLWIALEGEIATVGVTDYAQDQLSDVVFSDIKVSLGDTVQAGALVAVVESVKASSDIDAPLSGTVVALNETLNTSPETINADPYGAWILKLRVSKPEEAEKLMDAVEYAGYREL